MPATVSGPAGVGRAAGHRQAAAEIGDLLGLRLALVEEAADAVGELLGPGAEQRRGVGERGLGGGEVGERAGAGQGLDPADAAGRGAFGDELEGADVAGARDMGAAAELERVGVAPGAEAAAGAGAHRHDADLVAVLLAEERAGAEIRGGVGGHDPGLYGGVLADVGVDLGLDGGELVGAHRLAMGEVEAQPVRGDQAAALGDVVAERAAQRLVQEVGRRVVGADRGAAVVIDGEPRRRRRGRARPPRRGPDARRGRPSCARR